MTLFPAARLNSQRVRKNFYEKKFVTWYAEEIKKQMDAGESQQKALMLILTLFGLRGTPEGFF